MSKEKLIIGYVRCSGQSQLKDGGETIERQTELIRQYCLQKNLGEPVIIVDQGISGRSIKRPGYQQMLQQCKENKVATIITHDLSRIHRSLRNMLVFLDDVVIKLDINFICLKNDLINTSTPSGRAIISILSVFNQLYADELSVKVKSAIAYKKSKNEKTGGLLEYGHSLNGKQLIPNEQEQAAIKLMVELRQAGFTFAFVAKELKRLGYKTRTGNTNWKACTIRTIINRASTTNKKVA